MHGHAHDDHGHSHAHEHAHQHAHGHHHHHHGGGNERRLTAALVITAGFMLVELAGGLWAGSLALIADAGHMLADAGSLVLALFALRAARRPANQTYSYGHHRYEVLAAFVNGLLLLAISLWIVIEAVKRVAAPEPVQAHVMLITAALGLLANLGAFAVLRGGEHSENLRAALLHVLSDLLGSAAAIVAAGVILATGWTPADPILSAIVAALIIRGGWRLTRESAHILLEGVPTGFDADAVERDLVVAVPGLSSIHHLHAWSLTGDRPMMTLHAVLEAGCDRDAALDRIQRRLSEHFGVHHATVQIEPRPCGDAQAGCAPAAQRAAHGHH